MSLHAPPIGARTSSSRIGFQFRLDHLWMAVVPLMVALKVLLTPIAPYDFWWHLAYGRLIVQNGVIPATDMFSFTRAGAPYFDQPWLAQVLMFAGYQWLGADGLRIVQAAIVAGSYTLLLLLLRHWGAATRVAAFAALLAAVTAYDNWHVRPQTYVLPLWVVAIALLERWRRTGRTPAVLVPLVVVWANLHGTFTLPLVLGAIYVMGEGIRIVRGRSARSRADVVRLVAVLVLATAGTLLNPHGARLWWYVASLLGNRAVSELVTEWAPPRLGTAEGTIFFGAVALCAVALVVHRRAVPLTGWLALGAWTALALSAGRNIIWLGPLAATFIAPLWTARPATRRREPVVLNALLLGMLILPYLLVVPPFRDALPPRLGATLDPETPVAAVAELQRLPNPPRRMFNDNGFGSYLMWSDPDQPVFVDPRIEHYPLDQWYDYVALGNAERIDELTARYQVDGFLLHPQHQQDLIAALRRDGRWRVTIDTPTAVLFQTVQAEPKH